MSPGLLLTAPPNGLPSEETAVAEILPASVNHMSLYLVGADRTNGCASPMTNWPNTTRPKLPSSPAPAPAYLIQLPTSMRALAASSASLMLRFSIQTATGLATTKAKRKPVLSQLMAPSETWKYCADVLDTGANVSQFHDTTMLSSVI